jgi:hypothetical protein
MVKLGYIGYVRFVNDYILVARHLYVDNLAVGDLDVDILAVSNLDVDILAVGNLNVNISAIGDLDVDILAVGDLDVNISAVGDLDVGKKRSRNGNRAQSRIIVYIYMCFIGSHLKPSFKSCEAGS